MEKSRGNPRRCRDSVISSRTLSARWLIATMPWREGFATAENRMRAAREITKGRLARREYADLVYAYCCVVYCIRCTHAISSVDCARGRREDRIHVQNSMRTGDVRARYCYWFIAITGMYTTGRPGTEKNLKKPSKRPWARKCLYLRVRMNLQGGRLPNLTKTIGTRPFIFANRPFVWPSFRPSNVPRRAHTYVYYT